MAESCIAGNNQAMDDQSKAPSATIRFPGLRERLPEILLEAFSVLIAVLLAFAVEEWRDDRELAERAAEARAAIVAEIDRNQVELEQALEDLQATLDQLEAAAAARSNDESPEGLSLSVDIALLSSAAWKTAMATDSSRRLDYAWILQISELYELQELYMRAQWDVIRVTAELTSAPNASVDDVLDRVHGEYRLLRTLHGGLMSAYAEAPR